MTNHTSSTSNKHKNIIDYSISSVKSEKHIYLNGIIGPSEKYVEEFVTLRSAKLDDYIKIFINSPGGYLNTGMQFLNCIKDSYATIETILDGECASMAAFLSLSGDVITVNTHSYLMFHEASNGSFGKIESEILPRNESAKKTVRTLFNEYGSKVLSKEEINLILNGKDVYLTSTMIKKRLS